MSDDIAADLRSYTERFELSPRIQGKLMLEAADEIERLREGRDTMGNLWAKEKAEIERLRGENERLRGHIYASNRPQPEEVERMRAALQKIIDDAESDDGATAWDGADIARAALAK